MGTAPLLSTYITKLVATSASHVVASLVSLYYNMALFALAVLKGFFKELELTAVTGSLVLSQQAVRAVNTLTIRTLHLLSLLPH